MWAPTSLISTTMPHDLSMQSISSLRNNRSFSGVVIFLSGLRFSLARRVFKLFTHESSKMSQQHFIFKKFSSILLIISIIGKTYESLVQHKSIKLLVKCMKYHHRQFWQMWKLYYFDLWQQYCNLQKQLKWAIRKHCTIMINLPHRYPKIKNFKDLQRILINNVDMKNCCQNKKLSNFIKAVCDDFSCTSSKVLWTYFGLQIH
jgi:hypothetical protein